MKALILAGGSGSRLWPLSREERPKQFLKIGGDRSLLQATVSRLLQVCDPGDIFVVTTGLLSSQVFKEVSPYHIPERHILVEPLAKNTAPATAFAFKKILSLFPSYRKEGFLLAPADHWIEDNPALWSLTIKNAEKVAKRGKIVTFGISPSTPETDYGYIQMSQTSDSDGMYRVLAFREKPDLSTAKQYLLAGSYYWNSGMFCLTPQTFFYQLQLLCPELMAVFKKGSHEVETVFSTLPALSLDRAIMERSQEMVATPFPLLWNDVGRWSRLYETLEKDGRGNVKKGDVWLHNTQSSLVFSERKTLVVSGVEDLIIVETDDAVFVSRKGSSEDRCKELMVFSPKNVPTSWEHEVVLSEGE